MADFDKAARYQVKQDPPGFLAWLWHSAKPALVFHSWLDARRLALPVEGDLTCDTVAGLCIPDEADVAGALILEFKTESRSDTLDQMLDSVVRVRRESAATGRPFNLLGAAVVNLTGPYQTTEVTLGMPDGPCFLEFRILQRTLRDEDAAKTLEAIASGQTTRWLLPWIPLMRGGNKKAMVERWKEVARAEPDEGQRSILATLTVTFAELVDKEVAWRKNLEDWNVQKSALFEEARAEGRLEAHRDDLVALLENRFGTMPDEVVERIRTTNDLARLKEALLKVPSMASLKELLL